MSQLNVSKLEVLFYDFDQFSVDECIGYCWLTIGRLDICTDSVAPTVFWAEVLPIQDADGVRALFSPQILSKIYYFAELCALHRICAFWKRSCSVLYLVNTADTIYSRSPLSYVVEQHFRGSSVKLDHFDFQSKKRL